MGLIFDFLEIMSLRQIDFSKVLNDDQVYDHMMNSYDKLGRDWIVHQWSWMNNVYKAFKDHYKYLIVISLVEKTLQFYDQMNIKYSFDQFYSKPYLQIEKFSITELCEKLQLPKETVRRKVLELENLGVLKRKKNDIYFPDQDANYSSYEFLDETKYLKWIFFSNKSLVSEKTSDKNIGLFNQDNLVQNEFRLLSQQKSVDYFLIVENIANKTYIEKVLKKISEIRGVITSFISNNKLENKENLIFS